MHPVGRLDADTTGSLAHSLTQLLTYLLTYVGLLLFSSDGHLTQTLLNPSSEIEREYEALVVGHVNSTVLSEQLNSGIKTTEGTTSFLICPLTHLLTHSLAQVYLKVHYYIVASKVMCLMIVSPNSLI